MYKNINLRGLKRVSNINIYYLHLLCVGLYAEHFKCHLSEVAQHAVPMNEAGTRRAQVSWLTCPEPTGWSQVCLTAKPACSF